MEIIYLVVLLLAAMSWLGAFWYGYRARALTKVFATLLKCLAIIIGFFLLSNVTLYALHSGGIQESERGMNGVELIALFSTNAWTGMGDVLLFILVLFLFSIGNLLVLLVGGIRAYTSAKATATPSTPYSDTDILDD
jgi:hypothetical protein